METNQDKTKEELILELTQAKESYKELLERLEVGSLQNANLETELQEAKGEIERLNNELSGTDLEMGSMYGQIGSMQSLLTQKDKEIEVLKKVINEK